MERLEPNVFYSYAARNWGYHASKSSTEVERLILNLLHSTAKVSACSQAMIYNGHYDGESGMTGLHLTAYFGLGRSMSALLDKNANIETKDESGRTPLSLAAGNGHDAVVKLLLGKNADIKLKDESDRTPLSWAAGNGHDAVVKQLLDKNADIETKDSIYGRTPLLWAAENGYDAVVKLIRQAESVRLFTSLGLLT
jgi:ankyrin repeat protein